MKYLKRIIKIVFYVFVQMPMLLILGVVDLGSGKSDTGEWLPEIDVKVK